MEFEVPLLDELPAPRVGAVDDQHLVLFCNVIERGHQGEEVLLVVYVLLPVGGDEDVVVLL